MKGFGALVIVSILMSSLVFLHISKLRETELSIAEGAASSQSFEKIGFLKNVLKKSHEKVEGPDSAWRLEVMGLAGYYEVEIILDGNRAIIVDNRNMVQSEFYLR